LCRGRSGIRPIRRFDVSACPSKVGGIIDDLAPESIITDRAGRRMLHLADWVQTMGMCAAELACRDACVEASSVRPERLGVHFGAGRGGAQVSQAIFGLLLEALRRSGDRPLGRRLLRAALTAFGAVKPTHYLQQCPCFVSAYCSIRHGARGPALTNVNLCSAGAQAIGEAAWVIARDDADMMIAGGADSMLNPGELTAFCALDAVSVGRDGHGVSRPFDRRRDGCVVGEGAGVVILEELSHARRRGARVYAELLGYGASSDAHKVTAPPESGHGATLAMRRALAHARVCPSDVGHVNAHGTATPLNDRVETHAIKAVLGSHAYRIPVVSTKSMTGHLIAAAGALEAMITIKAVEEKRVPPTCNLTVPDPNCDLDYAAEGARRLPGLRVALSNSFAVGGSNACLAFGERPV
jgi:3-oxoacyl-[acyl-carrier-protein] synthase II